MQFWIANLTISFLALTTGFFAYGKKELSSENIGRVIACAGKCTIYRGEGFFEGRFRSHLEEGDDLTTGPQGHAWIMLLDGTLVRIAPNTSLSLREVNVSAEEIFYHARLNYGHIFWLARSKSALIPTNTPTTDTLFLPLAMNEANPSLKNDGKVDFQALYYKYNEIAAATNLWKKTRSYLFLATSNAEIKGYDPQFAIFSPFYHKTTIHPLAAEDYGHIASAETAATNVLKVRARKQDEFTSLVVGSWYEVDALASGLREVEHALEYKYATFTIKRIPSVLLAREILLQNYFRDLFQQLGLNTESMNHKQKMVVIGSTGSENARSRYRLWKGPLKEKSEMSARLKFIEKYSRKEELFQLQMLEQYEKRLTLRKVETVVNGIEDYYAHSLAHYFKIWQKDEWYKFIKGDLLALFKRRNSTYEREVTTVNSSKPKP